ncbi:MAG: response regulator [Anaerolineales bacterium]|nr:response regulator [Anaerolineales bacterium]
MINESGSTTILIVEDNVPNYILMARILGHMGYSCEWKTSGFEITEFARSLPRIDLILMDIRLPYEDGFQAFENIRKSPDLQQIPIAAVTAYASEELLNRAKNAGFNGFIGKPINPDRFSQQISQLLAGEEIWEI